jgi:hypothetical protein
MSAKMNATTLIKQPKRMGPTSPNATDQASCTKRIEPGETSRSPSASALSSRKAMRAKRRVRPAPAMRRNHFGANDTGRSVAAD